MNDILEKHINFWKGLNKAPLLNNVSKKKWVAKPYPIRKDTFLVEAQEVVASDFEVSRLVGHKDFHINGYSGDLIVPFGCVYPEAWIEGLIGCHVFASETSCTAKPGQESFEKAYEICDESIVLNSDWYRKMEECILHCISTTTEPVRQLHLRGIVDMLAAIVGEAVLCISVADEDIFLSKLADIYSNIYVMVYKTLQNLNKKWNDGYVSTWKIFAPGSLVDYQIDASSLFSKKQYEDCFLKYDKKIIDSFEYSIIHVHSCALRHIESLLKIEKLRAIEINLDRETNTFDMDEIVSYTNLIQANGKGVVLVGELTDDDLQFLLRRVKCNALAIDRWVAN